MRKSIIEVNLCPVIDAGADVAIFLGDTAQLYGRLIPCLVHHPIRTNGATAPWYNPIRYRPTWLPIVLVDTEDRYGCNTSDTVTVTVNPLPVVSAGDDDTLCAGAAITLNGSGATSLYLEQRCNRRREFCSGGFGYVCIVTGTDGNGCEDTDTMAVTVNPLPVVGAGNDIAVCANDSVTLNGSGASTYTWDNGVTDGVPFLPAATATYTGNGYRYQRMSKYRCHYRNHKPAACCVVR